MHDKIGDIDEVLEHSIPINETVVNEQVFEKVEKVIELVNPGKFEFTL